MAIQIVTQFMENYNFDDTEGGAYWKFKGGSVYAVMRDPQRGESYMDLVKELRALIENQGTGCEEFIASVKMVEDPLEDIDAWDSITYLTKVGGEWRAAKGDHSVEYNDAGDCVRGALRKREAWTQLTGGGRDNYSCKYFGEYAHFNTEA